MASVEDRRKYQKEYYARNKERRKAQQDTWRFKPENALKNKLYAIGYRDEHKQTVISHYGGICECCGESRIELLSIDHIEGNGAALRRQDPKHAKDLYKWIIDREYPIGYRVLCMNCNTSIGHYGYCPHMLDEGLMGEIDRIHMRLHNPTHSYIDEQTCEL